MTTAQHVFEALAGGPLPDWGTFERAISVVRANAGSTIFDHGDEVHDLFLVRSGLVKLVYLRVDGSEWIKSFIEEGMSFSSISSIAGVGSATFGAIAIEDCVLERLPFAGILRRADEDAAWSRAVRNALVDFALRKEERECVFLTMKPPERYRHLKTTRPNLLGRVPQKDLAAFLGVTPVGLSRIAGRMKARP